MSKAKLVPKAPWSNNASLTLGYPLVAMGASPDFGRVVVGGRDGVFVFHSPLFSAFDRRGAHRLAAASSCYQDAF
jgi:hypothetical protein